MKIICLSIFTLLPPGHDNEDGDYPSYYICKLDDFLLIIAAKNKSKRKRGGSKKGKSGVTWNEEPDEVVHNYVEECHSCHKVADEGDQKIVYTKRITEIPEQIQVSLQEHHIYKYECGN